MNEERPTRSRLRQALELLAPVLGLVLVAAIFGALEPRFLSELNLKTILIQTVVVALGAIGMTFVIASGGIDLSVGSVIALASMSVAALLAADVHPALAVLGGVATGGLCGFANGLLVVGLRLVPFIATLGTMGIARGLAKWVGGERSIEPAHEQVAPIQDMLTKSWTSSGLLLTVALSIAAAFLLKRTVFGVHTFAVGSSEPTARLCGVPVGRTQILIYVLAGAFAGLAGAFLLGRVGVGDPTAALGAELNVIAAVVIGGASLNGGTGSIFGSLLGALLMGALASGCNLVGVPTYVQEILIGAIIVLAVTLDGLRQRA